MENLNSSVLPAIVDASNEPKEKLPEVNTEINKSENNPQYLRKLLQHFTRDANFAVSRKDRLNDLLNRASATKWSPEKTQKMIRRLSSANREYEAATRAISHISTRLDAIQQESAV